LTAITHNWITKEQPSIAWDYTPCLDSDGAIKYVIGTGRHHKSASRICNQQRAAQLEEKIACC